MGQRVRFACGSGSACAASSLRPFGPVLEVLKFFKLLGQCLDPTTKRKRTIGSLNALTQHARPLLVCRKPICLCAKTAGRLDTNGLVQKIARAAALAPPK